MLSLTRRAMPFMLLLLTFTFRRRLFAAYVIADFRLSISPLRATPMPFRHCAPDADAY